MKLKLFGFFFSLVLFASSVPAQEQEGQFDSRDKSDEPSRVERPEREHGFARRNAFLKTLPEEERVKLKKLASEKPEEYKKEIIRRMDEVRRKEVQEVIAIREKYLNAATSEQKAEYKKEMEATVRRHITRHLDNTKRRIEETENQLREMQERLEKFKADYEKRKNGADDMIRKAVDDFTNPEKLPFQKPPRPPKN